MLDITLTAAGDRWADREEAAAYLASRPEVELMPLPFRGEYVILKIVFSPLHIWRGHCYAGYYAFYRLSRQGAPPRSGGVFEKKTRPLDFFPGMWYHYC